MPPRRVVGNLEVEFLATSNVRILIRAIIIDEVTSFCHIGNLREGPTSLDHF